MSQQQTEELRHAVLEYLARRQMLSFSAQQIHRGLQVNRMLDSPVSIQDVAQAVVFLDSAGHIRLTPDSMGATKYAQALTAGVLVWERLRAEAEGAV